MKSNHDLRMLRFVLPPLPASCGERVGVWGSCHRLRLAERPPLNLSEQRLMPQANPIQRIRLVRNRSYTCESCGVNAWAKPDVSLICGVCKLAGTTVGRGAGVAFRTRAVAECAKRISFNGQVCCASWPTYRARRLACCGLR
jgi:hypothetical protein